MAAFSKYALQLTLLLGLVNWTSCVASSGANDNSTYVGLQKLSVSNLRSLEYHLDVPGRDQIVTSTITFTEFMDSEGFDYGAVVYLPSHEADNQFELIHHDLNGDGFEDVLVPLMVLPQDEQDAASDGGYLALATVLNQQGQPVHSDTVFFDMIYEIKHINNQIVVQGSAEQWGNEETFTYRWTAAGLEEINRISLNLDEIPFPDEREQYFDYNLQNSRFLKAGAVDEPLVLTQRILGHTSEPHEETRHDHMIEVLARSERRMVIAVTQKRLGDDSVSAQRYRLEFVADGQQWRIDWIGQQFSCVSGRGRQAWHNELCS
ncbi:hypothetical protein N836_05355 [Leptolyngbya sp. Heron Island J]|uniref:hypothetical protein n=1 Tax=Leptolyngbya sp. Heron Island J TaxID=1385935 RepID=UPI0003B96A58|nr:hypothetical protein [Leptolyngbya sp. Heron Island J]ESA36990.1 hypothetical protein N836_05355 [Leptolyngbya sp. Heron Island J]